MPKTRVHVGRMSLVLLVTLIMPLIIGGLVDVLTETFPWVTIGFAVVSLPIAAFFVVRQGLAEMEQVIDANAPAAPAEPLAGASLPTQSRQG